MSNDQPPPGPPPDDDPFRKRPQEPGPGEGGGTGGGEGQGPPPGSPYGGAGGQGGPPPGGGSPYDTPGGGAGGPGGPYGGGMPPPYGPNAYGGGYGGPDPLAGMPPLAEFGKRFVARLVDILIIAIPLAVISLLAGGWEVTTEGDDWEEITDQVNTGRQWLWTLISLVAYIGYDTIMTKRNGQTVGKRLMKLRVAMLEDGRTPDTSSALMRAVVLWVPALVCCYCIWWLVILITVLTDKPYKQGLHDKAGKTVVVSAA
ncbi:RDD family protein [Streptomyces sp. NPDC049597]|uniref:RDD family protein n=1 Tax=Streptomyces sp. NPDC049597 TaxID=3155276 RepID=UPI003430130B